MSQYMPSGQTLPNCVSHRYYLITFYTSEKFCHNFSRCPNFTTFSFPYTFQVEIKRSSREKKKKLEQAFDVIKTNYKGEDMVTYKIWKRLMALAQPNLSKNQIDLLMMILDMNCSGHIGLLQKQ